MRQAARLDLTTYEDPDFYDRLERARVQATDRLAMIQQMGRLFQQILTTADLERRSWSGTRPGSCCCSSSASLPSFVGETHFAFLGYAKNFRQTPIKRIMDYLRMVGGSKEAAKELKLFNLSDYLTNRFTALSEQIYGENVDLSRKQAAVGRSALAPRHLRLLRRLRLRHLSKLSTAATPSASFSSSPSPSSRPARTCSRPSPPHPASPIRHSSSPT